MTVAPPPPPTALTGVSLRALPPAFKLAWLLAAAGALLLGTVLLPVWASRPELADRFLIPLASAWLVWRARPALVRTPSSPSPLGFLLLVPAAALFALGWYLKVRVGPRPMLVWWLTATLLATVFGLALVQWGWGRARKLVFPLAFCLFALPVPGRIQPPLTATLQEWTTRGSAAILPRLGIATARNGYVLRLPRGDLGVAEACSGVRSVTALIAIAVLAAYLRGFGLLRGAALLAVTVGIVVVSNTVRIVVTGVLQEWLGPAAIEGLAHEALGVLVILVGLGLIVAVSGLMVGRRRAPAPGTSTEYSVLSTPYSVPIEPARGGWVAVAVLLTAGLSCAWAERFRQELYGERLPDLDRLSPDYPGWHGEDVPVLPAVAEMLSCDRVLCRTNTDPLGRQLQLWVMFWANPASTANAHNPDICWPSRGWTLGRKEVKPVPLGDGPAEVPITRREFRRERDRQMILYWSQRGHHVLTEAAEADELYGYQGWVQALLSDGGRWEDTACLAVLVGTDFYGPPEPTEKMLQDFSAVLAAELYRVCPWALPEAPTKPK